MNCGVSFHSIFSGVVFPLQKQLGNSQFVPCMQPLFVSCGNGGGILLATNGRGVISTNPWAAARGVVVKACNASTMSWLWANFSFKYCAFSEFDVNTNGSFCFIGSLVVGLLVGAKVVVDVGAIVVVVVGALVVVGAVVEVVVGFTFLDG